jgi:hypothetical protein
MTALRMILDDDPNILTCGNTAFVGDDEAPSFCLNFMFTSTDEKWTVSLLMILDHANTPDYTFGEVLEWACSASANSYANIPSGARFLHSKNVDALINSVHYGNNLLGLHWMSYVLTLLQIVKSVAKSKHHEGRKFCN